MPQHDILVIGGGPGGYVAAIRAAQLGQNAACVEKERALGGTCLRIGCIPSKALLESSERYFEARHALAPHGIEVGAVKLNLAAMMARKEKVVETLTRGIDGLFKKNKVTRYLGAARLAGPGKAIVDSSDGPIEISARHIIIATGSQPATLRGVELDGEFVGTSTEALSYDKPPKSLVVIGGGYIGMELGSVWNRLGTKVIVVEYLNRILPGTDQELAAEALTIFQKQGIEFHLGKRVTAARADKSGGKEAKSSKATAKGGAVVEVEGMDSISAERVLLAVGRVPFTAGLGLETVGIQLDNKGRIPVDDFFRTSAEGIYAIGDVIEGPMLAHKAEEEGVACVEQIVNDYSHVNYDAIPAVIFTDPEIAAVGRTEDELNERNIPYRKGSFPFRANGRALALGHATGKVKVLAHAETDRVLGVHILGPRAGDLIAEAVAAIQFGATSEDIARTCHAHPTLSEALKEAAMSVTGKAISY
jgi:dihydrolipoamide dehydrogenase